MSLDKNVEMRLYSQDLPAISLGAGIETAAIAGAIAIVESGQNIALKVAELGAVGIGGVLGVGLIAMGVQGIRDRRFLRAHAQEEFLSSVPTS